MTIKPSDNIKLIFTTNASTGALVNADSTPTAVLYYNGASSVTGGVANIKTGVYSASAATAASFVAGAWVQLYVAATCASVAGGAVIWQDAVDTKRVSGLNDIAAGAAMSLSASAITATAISASAFRSTAFAANALAAIADAIWNETSTGHTTSGYAGAQLWTDVDAILAYAGTDGVVLADDAITKNKFDESTAWPLLAADAAATQIARVGADADTLETLSDQLDAVKTDTAATLSDTGTDGVVVGSFTTAAKTAIESEVDDALGSGTGTALTAIPWNATWDTEVQSECTDALNAYDPPTDTEMDAGFAAVPAAAWAYATRTLTQSATAVTAAVSGSTITIHRGDSLSAALTGLGNISTRTKLWFTIKTSRDDADTAAIIQIEETAGLLYLNGAAGTAANGDITVDDATAGNITVTLDEVETANLALAGDLHYDVQMKTATAIQTLTTGSCNITRDVTRATS